MAALEVCLKSAHVLPLFDLDGADAIETQVSHAVAAIITTLHSAAELSISVRRNKWRRSSISQKGDESQCRQLQMSLEITESQLDTRFGADVKKMGDSMRQGDDTARDRLIHIDVCIQTEIISSLRLVAKYEKAVLDWNELNAASLRIRKDALNTVDELKHRIAFYDYMQRSSVDSINVLADAFTFKPITQSHHTTKTTSGSPATVLNAVSAPATSLQPASSSTFAHLFSGQRRDRVHPEPLAKTAQEALSNNTGFSPALHYFLRNKDASGVQPTMKDIDELIVAYQGLRVVGDRADTLAALTGRKEASKRDTLAVLNGGHNNRDTIGLNREAQQLLKELPPLPGGHGNTQYPAYNHNVFDDTDERRLSDWIDNPEQAPNTSARWSAASTSSSVYSEHTVFSHPSSLYPSSSAPSRASPTSLSSLISHAASPPSATSLQEDKPAQYVERKLSNHSSLSSSRTASTTSKILPQFNNDLPPLPPSAPSLHMHRPQGPVHDASTAIQPRMRLAPDCQPRGRSPDGVIRAETSVDVHPSQGITRSRSPLGITKTTVVSSAKAQMMDGRPCKDNNYWGFCKGAWSIRENAQKGLGLETRPEGMYTTTQIWRCKSCCFEGASVALPHPTKKNKKQVVMDPSIYVSVAGIRYRWIFLAKSHVKKKTAGDVPRPGARRGPEDPDCSYGCVLCSVEGNVTGIYGNVETLMNHIFMEHARPDNISEHAQARGKCIVGRTAGLEEEWDLNIPRQDAFVF